MFNRTVKNDDIDINQDVNELADSLEALLKSYGSDAKDEVDSARSQAETGIVDRIGDRRNSGGGTWGQLLEVATGGAFDGGADGAPIPAHFAAPAAGRGHQLPDAAG